MKILYEILIIVKFDFLVSLQNYLSLILSFSDFIHFFLCTMVPPHGHD